MQGKTAKMSTKGGSHETHNWATLGPRQPRKIFGFCWRRGHGATDQSTQQHPLFQPEAIPGGGLSVWQPDWMHVKLLGTDSTLLGSCLLFLCCEVLPNGQEANLEFIWESVQLYYKEHRTRNRLGRLTLNMIRHQPFPKLVAKAVEIFRL